MPIDSGLEDAGFTVEPDYRGVRISQAGQKRDVEKWGSFPQDFIDFVDEVGTAPFWYSSGTSTDSAKVALPITISFDADAPVIPEPGGGEEPAPTPEPGGSDPEPPPIVGGSGSHAISNAVLRWGMSNEANNAAHNPGTYNFFSAGQALPRRGLSVRAGPTEWRAEEGNVQIEKFNGATWSRTTWDGWKTTRDGTSIKTPTDGVYSDHQVVVRGGTGQVDPAAGTATISWEGDFTVLFYSGASFFYVSDPVLRVADGVGELTAEVSGYRSDREDPTVREAIPARTVTLANLPAVELAGAGITATPAYRGVSISQTGQYRRGSDWGSFPQSFISFVDEVGTAPFWYSSGTSTDSAKVALPITISFDASAPLTPPAPASGGAAAATPQNTVLTPPRRTTPSAPRSAVPAPAARPVVPPTAAPVGLASFDLPIAHDLHALPPAPSIAAASNRWWWIGGALLLMAAALLAAPSGSTAPVSRRSGGSPT